MDYLTLTSTQPVNRPVQQRPERDSQPALGRPKVFDHGPPGTGAPPPDKKAANPQKEVNANELKPQAKILDLLEEILPVGLQSLLPQQGRPDLSNYSDTAAFGLAIGDDALSTESIKVGDLLSALGVELPKDLDTLDFGLINKAIAEQIVESGVPPNVRNLLASLLQGDDGQVESGQTSGKETLLSTAKTGSFAEPVPAPTGSDIGTRMIGPPVRPATGSYPSDVPLVQEQPTKVDTGVPGTRLTLFDNGNRITRFDHGSGIRQLGTIQLGRPVGASANDLEVTSEQLTRNTNHLEGKIVEALRFKQVIAEPATTGIDPAQLSNNLVKGFALKKAPLVQPVITTHANPDTPIVIIPANESALTDSVSKEVRASIDIQTLSSDSSQTDATKVGVTATQLAGKDAKAGKNNSTLETTDQDILVEEGVKTSARSTFVVSEEPEKIEVNPFGEILNEDTSLEESLIDKDADGIKHISDVKLTKSTAPVMGKVDFAMERVSEVQNKIVEHVQEMAAMRGNGKVTIRLNPDDLGTITLAVSSFGSNVDTKITASNESVRHALHIQRTDLVQSIESKGLSLSSFTVGQEAGSEAQAQNQSHAQSQGDTMRQEFERASNIFRAQSSAPTEAMSPSHYVSRSDRAVDYLA